MRNYGSQYRILSIYEILAHDTKNGEYMNFGNFKRSHAREQNS
uniref:Uncharacterized protein n=1 Tax=Romanomermis culicivorax TaxID=13658 RepID=A0A915K6D2_ROMCU